MAARAHPTEPELWSKVVRGDAKILASRTDRPRHHLGVQQNPTNMNTQRFLPLFRTTLAAVFATLSIAAQSYGVTENKAYGNWYAGGSTSVRANVGIALPPARDPFAPTTITASSSNVARVRLFGREREAASMSSSLLAEHRVIGFDLRGPVFENTSAGTFTVRIGGRTMLSDARTNTSLSNSLAADVFLQDVPTLEVSLLGLGVMVRGGVTARATYDFTPEISFNGGLQLRLNGPLRSSAVGTAAASVSALGATAGVASTLVFADTTAQVALTATPTAVSGSITGSIRAIHLAMGVFASAAGLTASASLIDYSTPAQSFQRPLARL